MLANVETGRTLTKVGEASGPESLRQMYDLVRDCVRRRPLIYWADMIITTSIAYAAGLRFLTSDPLMWYDVLLFFVAGLALFRTGSFIHEIQHMGRGEMPIFKVVWNLFVGIPLMMPSNMYDNHIDHHRVDSYGTARDGEYLPLATASWKVWLYFVQVPILPLLALLRFGVLVPLSFVHPRLRQLLLERASSYGINPAYRRRIPNSAPRRLWAAIDLACFAFILTMGVLVAKGALPWLWVGRFYLLIVFSIGLNWVRNAVAHGYGNPGDSMSLHDQMLDSITISGSGVMTELLFPLGLRYHSLHHLFASVPYHSLGEAHQRLMEHLPENAGYRKTVYPSLWAVLSRLLTNAKQSKPPKLIPLAR